MFFSSAALFALAASLAAAKDSRTYAVNHFYGKGALVEGRMDPIVSPGKPSSHVHTIQGGNAFSETLSDTALMASTCTSSLIKNDKSAYWTPKMYFQDPVNGTFEDVPMFYMNVYYFFEATDDPIVAFPQGLRMFSGNTELRTPPATGGKQILDPAQGTIQPVQFTCPRSNYNTPSYPSNSDGMHGVGIQDPNNEGAGVGFPDMNCDGYASPLRADIHFPSCYNTTASLEDYENNMAWPSSAGASAGRQNCPAGYIHVPHIFYEVYWNTPLFVNRWTQGQSKQPFVLSNGDNTGYSLHGDFIAGWDVPTLQQIIDNCDAGDSGMDTCPGLIGGINDPSASCNIQSSVPETIDGVLSALPGNNPVTGWGTNGAAPPPPVSSDAPTSSSTGGAPASSGPASSAPNGGPPSYPASSPSTIVSSSLAAPNHVQSTPSTSSSAPAYSAPGSGSSPNSSPSTPTTRVSTVPSSSSSFCGGIVATATTTMTTWYTPSSTASSPTSPPPSGPTNPTIPSWSYTGCYTDSPTSRVFSGITFANFGAHNVTTTGCVAYCDANSYTIAGTEYTGQCFCGNALGSASVKVSDKLCNMVCEGDKTQLCGGGLALTVYEKGGSGSWKREEELPRVRFGRRGMRY